MATNKENALQITEKLELTIIVPCFNEEVVLPHLLEKLQVAQRLLNLTYDVHLILIDDGSRDNTWQGIQKLAEILPRCGLVRNSVNLGLGASILLGIRAAKTEIVCSIDSDCSYDPSQLSRMVPMLTPGIDLVTASPYHPHGMVYGVARWRVFLSKSASFLYRQIFVQKLFTYTSCFRVYRRSTILKLDVKRGDFLGVTELIGKLDLRGFGIAEAPARLGSRIHGVSKIKTVRVIVGHVSLLFELLILRIKQILLGREQACSEL